MRYLALILVPLLALAGCGHKAREETTTTVTRDGVTTTTVTTREVDNGHRWGWGRHRDHDRRTVSTSDSSSSASSATAGATSSGFAIDTDDFKANLDIPGFSFGGDHMNMDGMTLYPGSTVRGMRVHAVDRNGTGKGEVTMEFTSPAPPLTVAQHMADAARKAGFALNANTASLISGSKTDDGDTNTFTVTLTANGAATAGRMTMSGAKAKS